MYTYYWYEGDTARYSVIYYEGYDSFYKMDTMNLTLSREENGRSQKIRYSNVSGGPVCAIQYEEDDDYSEEYMQSVAQGAAQWRTKESMVGQWAVSEKIENGTALAVENDTAQYLELDWGSLGYMSVPELSDINSEISWRNAYDRLQENPEEKLVFEVTVDYGLLPNVIMEYYYADDSIIVKNAENTLAYRLERAE